MVIVMASSSYTLRLNQHQPSGPSGSLPANGNPAGASGFFHHHHHPAATNEFLAVTNSYLERFSSGTPMMAYQAPDVMTSEKFNNFYAANGNNGSGVAMHNGAGNAINAGPMRPAGEQQSDFFLPYLSPAQSHQYQQQQLVHQSQDWPVAYEQCNGNEALKRFAVSRLIQHQERPSSGDFTVAAHLLSPHQPGALITRDDSETSSHTTTDKSDGSAFVSMLFQRHVHPPLTRNCNRFLEVLNCVLLSS